MLSENEKEIEELVIARLQTFPDGTEVSIGSAGEFTKEELIQHVKSGDELGRKIIDVEMSFLRALKDGLFYGEDLVGDTA